MSNSLFQQMNPNIARLAQMIKVFKSKDNPEQAVNEMLRQNPDVANLVNENQGMTSKQLFLMTAKQMGVDANQIISMLQ